jgi:hypothetical protein
MIFSGFSICFGRFCPLLEDLETFLRPDIGRKLGGCYQLQTYINHRFLEALGRFIEGEMLRNLTVKAIFMQGKLLRRATLWAISGSFVHLFSVP